MAKKVVWILGAGFSKSLGGPLLNEFFEMHRFDRLRKGRWWQGVENQQWINLCARWQRLLELFNRGLKGSTGHPTVPKPWGDAEEFVEHLHRAATGDEQAVSILNGVYKPGDAININDDAEAASKLLAAVTYEFTYDAVVKSERWKPYRRWVGLLGEHDHVITFNYDRTVEMAVDAKIEEILNTQGSDPNDDRRLREFKTKRYHKLHGSVDWFIDPANDERVVIEPGEIFNVLSDPKKGLVPVIGVPGPEKSALVGGQLKREWEAGLGALRQADAVVFVGYRFPSTDNEAKSQLMDAIGQNDEGRLNVHSVLGPRRSDDVERLHGMLKWILENKRFLFSGPANVVKNHTYELYWEPMYAEDFLTVFNTTRL